MVTGDCCKTPQRERCFELRTLQAGNFSLLKPGGLHALMNATDADIFLVVRVFDDVLSGIGLHNSQTYYVKRVIGLPGDQVACCTDGKVTVNGVPLTETSYLYPGDAPSFPFKTVTVPPAHLWVMGDHRGDSDDSRYHTIDPGGGAIPENEVVGRAFLIIWPVSQLRDLPIPSTFSQAALHAGPAGAALIGAADVGGTAVAAVAAVPVAGAAAGAGVLGAPWLLLRRRRRR